MRPTGYNPDRKNSDQENLFYFQERSKESMKRGSYNYSKQESPTDIEGLGGAWIKTPIGILFIQ